VSADPPWLQGARRYIGLREIKGPGTEPTISRWLRDLRAWWRDDETPWCGTAMAAWMQEAGITPPKHWYRALAWLEFGVPVTYPARGAVVVFDREGGGHVGIVTGVDHIGRLLVLGGNQGDAVNVAAFEPHRVRGYRWPATHLALMPADRAPVFAHAGQSSRNEA
jgi:uncharacterized protein (TIGR02594 family)